MKDTNTINKLKDSVVQSRALKANMKAHCIIHRKQCQPEVGALCHLAGTPCTADSQMGLQEGKQSLPFCYFLTCCAMRLALQEPIVVQECVDAFDRSNFTELLTMYDWTFVCLSPIQFGWPISRTRQWAVCPACNKQQLITISLIFLYSLSLAYIKHNCNTILILVYLFIY